MELKSSISINIRKTVFEKYMKVHFPKYIKKKQNEEYPLVHISREFNSEVHISLYLTTQ